MDKQTNLHECVARHTREVLQLFPQKGADMGRNSR